MATNKKEKEEKKEPPVKMGEVSHKNPSGIEEVSDEFAQHVGGLQGNGGPGAAGCVVAGPIVHVATKGGTKPLPVKDLPEDVKTSGGKQPSAKQQPTSQVGALASGKHNDDAEQAEEHNTEFTS